MRLIDADKAEVERINTSYGSYSSVEDIKEWLDEQPTIDSVPVVHGRWIPVYSEIAVCSICGHVTGGLLTNYCPNCGAKMDGEVMGDE